MDRRRPNRVVLRAFSMFGVAFAIALTVLGSWSVADEHRGSEALADVLDVEHRGPRTFLTVKFATNHGHVCESTLRVTADANRTVRAGQHVRVHYAKSDPCLRVREVGDRAGWLMVLIAVLLLMIFAILAYVVWRQPQPGLPLRYSSRP